MEEETNSQKPSETIFDLPFLGEKEGDLNVKNPHFSRTRLATVRVLLRVFEASPFVSRDAGMTPCSHFRGQVCSVYQHLKCALFLTPQSYCC